MIHLFLLCADTADYTEEANLFTDIDENELEENELVLAPALCYLAYKAVLCILYVYSRVHLGHCSQIVAVATTRERQLFLSAHPEVQFLFESCV